MFVRLRVSSTNLYHVIQAAELWGAECEVVLTFMRYYNEEVFSGQYRNFYTKRKNVNNIYWCPTYEFIRLTLEYVRRFNSKIEMCGTPTSSFCKDCLLCKKFYYEAKRRMNSANEKT